MAGPGVPLRSTPGSRREKISEARGAAVRRIIANQICNRELSRPLRGLYIFFADDDPGVPLRSTPGFMLSSAPRTEDSAALYPQAPSPAGRPSRARTLDAGLSGVYDARC